MAQNCPTLDGSFQPEVTFDTTVGLGINLDLAITATLRSDPAVTYTAPRPTSPSSGAVLPAGIALPGELWIDHWGPERDLDLDSTIQQLTMTARLQPQGGTTHPLAVAVEHLNRGYHALVLAAAPDTDGPASLRLTVTWSDRCFAYAATGAIDVTLASTTTTKGCRIDPNEGAFWDDLTATFGPSLTVGSGTVDIFWRWAAARYLPIDGPGGDGPAPVQLWQRDQPAISAAPDGSVIVSYENPDVRLRSLDVVFHRRSDVITALDGSSTYPFPNVPEVSHATILPASDGSFAVPVAATPGDYVVWLSFQFDATCATGTAWALASMTVGPSGS